MLLIDADAGGRHIPPHHIGSQELETGSALRASVPYVIAVLNPRAGGAENGADFSGQTVSGLGREVFQGQTGNDRGNLIELLEVPLQQLVQLAGVAGDDMRAREAFAQQAGQFGRFFNGHQPVLPQAALKQDLGDRSGARSQFQNEFIRIKRKPVGHGAREVLRTGQNRADLLGTMKQFLQEECRGTQMGAYLSSHFFWNGQNASLEPP